MGKINISSTQQHVKSPYQRVLFPRKFTDASASSSSSPNNSISSSGSSSYGDSPVERLFKRAIAKIKPEPFRPQQRKPRTDLEKTELYRRLNEPFKKITSPGNDNNDLESSFKPLHTNDKNEEKEGRLEPDAFQFRPCPYSTIDWNTWRTLIPNSRFCELESAKLDEIRRPPVLTASVSPMISKHDNGNSSSTYDGIGDDLVLEYEFLGCNSKKMPELELNLDTNANADTDIDKLLNDVKDLRVMVEKQEARIDQLIEENENYRRKLDNIMNIFWKT